MKGLEVIYHYCNTEVFKSIVDTKQIWINDVNKSNDFSEYKSGFDIILRILEEKGLADRPIFQEIHPDKLNNKFRILVGCFSQEGDVGSQWRLYGDDSKGFSIGFDKVEIEQFNTFSRFMGNGSQPITSHVKFYSVCYDKSKFSEKATNLIDQMEENGPIKKDLVMALALRRLAALYKDHFFTDEREIRAIVEIEPDRDEKYHLDERDNVYGGRVTYHKLLTSYQNLSAIKEVIIGANCPCTREGVERILHEHGLNGVKVRNSSGRDRYRTVP